MGDVTLVLNKTSGGGRGTGGGAGGAGGGGGGAGGGGDDEDNWNEMSGSGDGDETLTYSFSSKPPVKTSPRISTGRRDTGAESQDNLIVYIVSAAVIFAVVAIIIVVVVICCCRRRNKAKRARLASQGNEMKAIGLNKETRVFQTIAGGNTLHRRFDDNDQMMSRFLPPPTTVAPPPPTSSKARVAPEAEKLLKANSGSSASSSTAYGKFDIHQPEVSRLLPSDDQHHYEEIPSASNPVRVNGMEDANKVDETVTFKNDSQDNRKIKDTDLDSQGRGKNLPVAKPRKSVEVVDVADENIDGYLESRMIGSAV